jgi:DNA-binding NtrC family response regulator
VTTGEVQSEERAEPPKSAKAQLERPVVWCLMVISHRQNHDPVQNTSMELAQACARLRESPFGARDPQEAASVVLAARREQLDALVDSPARATETVLAVLHARALSGARYEALLQEPVLSARVERRVSLDRPGLARVALASARCVARLQAMHGTSTAMQTVRASVWAACFGRTLLHGLSLARVVRDHDVLITGETGTGKEQVARAIAAACPGAHGEHAPFAEINASAVPDTLVEAELFGHVKGAFTGALAARQGLVRSADGGCLFLDEVGDLPLHAQVKLLRVIETDQVQPLGADRLHQADVRFVAATHHDLGARVAEGRFRADLYQRLAGVVIRLPPLRDRPEDVAAIGEAFVQQAVAGSELDASAIVRWVRGPEARRQPWPGNVRELQNVLRSKLLGLEPPLPGPEPVDSVTLPARIDGCEASLAEVESWYVRRALERCGGNVAAAARLLAVDRTTITRKMRGQ